MPMMYLAFPEWFHRKYPGSHLNLLANQDRLTAHIDVYHTLRHLLYFGSDKHGLIDEKGYCLANVTHKLYKLPNEVFDIEPKKVNLLTEIVSPERNCRYLSHLAKSVYPSFNLLNVN